MVDVSTLIAILAGAFVAILSSTLTYIFAEMRHQRSLVETVTYYGTGIVDSLESLMLYVGENQDKLESIQTRNWNEEHPSNRAELNARLSKALEAFPLPVPEDIVPSMNEPFSFTLRSNLKWNQERIRELNELASSLRDETKRTDHAIATFLGKAQIFIAPTSLQTAAVVVYGNFVDAVQNATGRKPNSKQRRKKEREFGKALKEEYEARFSALKSLKDQSDWFEVKIRDLPKD